MLYTGYDLLFLFFIYSFLGWCLEVIYAALGRKEFVNRGFLNGMLCPVYGISMVFILIFMESLRGEWFYLFLGCMIVGTVMELLTGLLLEKVFHLRLWDYSGKKFQAGGYICMAASIVWGMLGVFTIKFFNPLLMIILGDIPYVPGCILLFALCLILAVDVFMTTGVLLKMKRRNQKMTEIAKGLNQASKSLQAKIIQVVNRRMNKAFPNMKEEDETEEKRQELLRQKAIFAYGCGFHKIVWIFFLGAFLGDMTETIFCRIVLGTWMSRSSVVYGSFSLVWGIGVAGATILLYRYRNREDRYIFLAGTFLGGAYEYICSVFTELAFGTVFWDYSDIPFNLGGRINLLYCFFWGIAAWVWMKRLYPLFSKWIEKIPKKPGAVLTYLILIFMVFNIGISTAALARYGERAKGNPPENGLEIWIDGEFTDGRMEEIYPNAVMTEGEN
ncbi:MAG: putative ABC transporter permease [Lachnospiraceae bacterium]|nr:putative ABC transporter permease [Lachnospiraceae bacterium]